MPGGCREAEDRHGSVDGPVFAGPDPERLVPDPDVAQGPDCTVEPPPRLRVRQVGVPGEQVQGIDAAPVQDQQRCPPEPPLESAAAQSQILAQHLQHRAWVATGHHLRIRSGWLSRIPIRKTTKSPSMSAV